MNFELDITRRCNFSCPGCDRLCNIIQDSESDMVVDDVYKIVKEINDLHIIGNNICVIGGEPTLNPHCYEICKYIKKYLKNFKRFTIATNHTNSKVLDKIGSLNFNIRWDEGTGDITEIKKGKFNKHLNILISPSDKNTIEDINRTGCWVSDYCGVSIHKYKGKIKYFYCAVGSSLCKLLNKEEYLKNSLTELLNSNRSNILHNICKHCLWNSNIKYYVKDTYNEITDSFKDGLNRLKNQF